MVAVELFTRSVRPGVASLRDPCDPRDPWNPRRSPGPRDLRSDLKIAMLGADNALVPLLESKRLGGHVVFHCPACATDRVGQLAAGDWSPWPHDLPMFGPHIECAACAAQTSTCGATWGPVGLSPRARWNDAVRSAAAGVVLAGGPTEETRSAAVDLVRRTSSMEFDLDDLRRDLIDPRLWVRVRGDVLLLGEDLVAAEQHEFVAGLAAIAEAAPNRADAEDFVSFCRELLDAMTV